ncbi:MAG: AAA family ATPase [Algicola sp.]|nr:AAA family ATPase [Algicola sp.]
MKIQFVEIQNFRKLKCCRINFSEEETLFVGANNSGKTSAMDALIHFLDEKDTSRRGKLKSTDFTLSNWHQINAFAESWSQKGQVKGVNLSEWQAICPSVDVWLKVEPDEIHRVSHLIPTLKWRGGELGVRLVYQPKDIEKLQADYLAAYRAVQALSENVEAAANLTLWPVSMRDFLDKHLNQYFVINAYILDPSEALDAQTQPQVLGDDMEALKSYPFSGLFKVDIIDAQRGFSDPNAENSSKGNLLAGQINQYYTKHLNPSDLPDREDLDALLAIEEAKNSFDDKLNEAFKSALGEIRQLGYPGFNDPDIRLVSKVNPVDSLNHEAAVQFDIHRPDNDINAVNFTLPEQYNGLGYKNLISMVFRLISYRDAWMRVGKAGKRRTEEDNFIEPLHIVLIEEPEAHLHAQVQQVFIRKAFEVLREHPRLGEKVKYSTQMVVSTHSSHLAHEVDFANLRYFKRKPALKPNDIPTATVVDLSDTFGGKKDQTAKFVTRYLKTTHCDLFFANGIILVEGAAERMLIPHFIATHYKQGLHTNYISILEVGGAHAHRLKPLIDILDLHTLVITDTDAVDDQGKKVRPQRGEAHKTSSDTLKKWLELEDHSLDSVLDLDDESKVTGNVRAAYQTGIKVEWEGAEEEAIPYTFEDALALTNMSVFKGLEKPTGMAAKMKAALEQTTLEACCVALYEALAQGKAKLALDLLFDVEPEEFEVPEYIKEGLDWLETQLKNVSNDFADPVNDINTTLGPHGADNE